MGAVVQLPSPVPQTLRHSRWNGLIDLGLGHDSISPSIRLERAGRRQGPEEVGLDVKI